MEKCPFSSSGSTVMAYRAGRSLLPSAYQLLFCSRRQTSKLWLAFTRSAWSARSRSISGRAPSTAGSHSPGTTGLCVLFVREVSVYYTGGGPLGRSRWQDNPEAQAIMALMLKLGEERDICVMPLYAVSEDPPTTIVDLAATMGVDYLIIGATQ